MRLGPLTLLVGILLGVSATANADQRFFLVGLRHIYRIAAYPDIHEQDRKLIEDDFAGSIDLAQQQFDRDMNSIADEEAQDNGSIHQIDRDAVEQNIEQATADAEDKRDASLCQLYTQCDEVRDQHPELTLDQDGPYQVMAIDCDSSGFFTTFEYLPIYIDYVEECPLGLTFGVVYPNAYFVTAASKGHSTWLSSGSPVFAPIYIDKRRVILHAPIRRSVLVNRGNWIAGRPPVVSLAERQALARNMIMQVAVGIMPKQTIIPNGIGPATKSSRYTNSGDASLSTTATSKYASRRVSNVAQSKAIRYTNAGSTAIVQANVPRNAVDPVAPPKTRKSRYTNKPNASNLQTTGAGTSGAGLTQGRYGVGNIGSAGTRASTPASAGASKPSATSGPPAGSGSPSSAGSPGNGGARSSGATGGSHQSSTPPPPPKKKN